MRFPLAALFFAALLFVCAIGWVITSYLLYTLDETLTAVGALSLMSSSGQDAFTNEVAIMHDIFGVNMIIFFIILVVIFVVDSLRTEPERYIPSWEDY